MKKSILALLSAFLLISGVFAQSPANDSIPDLPVKSERVYEKPLDNGDGTATYKKQVYQIETGPRGGRYIWRNERKIYIPKK